MEPFVLDPGNTAWMLAAASVVLLMTPALAFFYGGMTRSKSALNMMMMMSFGALALVGPVWMLWGYSETFGTNVAGIVGDPFEFFALHDLTDDGGPMAATGVLIGLFANVTRAADGAVTSYTWAPDGALNGLFYGGGFTQLATQTVVAINAILISGVMAVIIGLALKYTMGWRIPEEHEVVGVDVTTHGEAANDLELSSGSGASGVLTGSAPKTQGVKT
jgi:ammonia channel protein AmtB